MNPTLSLAVCLLISSLVHPGFVDGDHDQKSHDLVIYGGTCSAVIAAVQAKKMGKSVIIVSPDKHLGGLSSGGLGWTDSGKKDAIGGLSRDFYHRVWKHYQQDDAWEWQQRSNYGNRAQSKPSSKDGATMWVFEPHVAEKIFEDYISEYEIPVIRDEWLNRTPGQGVMIKNGRISAIRTLSGQVYRGKMFLDTTYEGDLMAAAGVEYHVGREANSAYGENWNGIQVGVLHHAHYFKNPIDPYKIKGDPSSGLLPRISAEPPGVKGAGDHRIQAYCFRMCLTNAEENRIPFAKPVGYDPSQYELLVRVFEGGWRAAFNKFDPLPNHKTDTNNHGPFSTDNIGYNYDYPDGSYEQRRAIIKEHEVYQQGLMYFLANDPRVPVEIRSKMQTWGLPKDEFVDNGGWPHQLYIREARRMVGEYVMTEQDCLDQRDTPASVGMGSYTIDSHNVQRYVKPDGYVQNEGDIGVKTPEPYEISYGSIVPKKQQCENLLVPVCVSSSHIAFGSIRMEPVFMLLGQSAATAAVMAIDAEIAVQDVDYQQLREQLLKDGQVLEWESNNPWQAKNMKGIVVDDTKAQLVGNWTPSTSKSPFIDHGYQHDGNDPLSPKEAHFKSVLQPGEYEVILYYSAMSNRASNVPVTIHHAHGEKQRLVDQTKIPKIEKIGHSLGVFTFDNEGTVIISNQKTDGYVIIDAVQWLPHE